MAVLAVSIVGCGSSNVADITDRQEDAVRAATKRTCDRYEECGRIGTDKTYTTRDECDAEVKSYWNDRWPAADCNDRINGDNLETCLQSVDTTDCNSYFDKFVTAFGACAKSDVCAGE